MANYSVAVSGFQNTSAALDTVSNNIANANTVGYKAGEYVFADQFAKVTNARDASRTGMGVQNLNVRRPMIQGTLTNSKNPLDLAITGNGLFRLQSSPTNPNAVYYSRNGQFRLDNQGYIVNENGMYLTGYQASANLEYIQDTVGLLKMPPPTLGGRGTAISKIGVMLDSRSTPFTKSLNVAFDPTQPTYNNKTTQTIYDSEGHSHTLEVFYRRIADNHPSAFELRMDRNGYAYKPGASSSPNTLGTTEVTINPNSVLRVDTPAQAINSVASISSTTINLTGEVGSQLAVGMRIFVNGVDTGATVTNAGSGPTDKTITTSASLATVASSGAGIAFYKKYETGGSGSFVSGTNTLTAGSLNNVTTDVVGYRVFENDGTKWVDTGLKVTEKGSSASTVVLDGNSYVFTSGRQIEFRPELSMTLETPNGATLAVRGTSNNNDVLTGGASLKLLGNKSSVEVYAAVDGVHVGKDVTSGLTTNRSIAAQTSSVQGYKPVSRIDFVDGRNIDSLIPDPGSANPSFFTDTTISGQWKLPGGATENYSIKLDLSDTALEAMEFAVNKSGQDGEAATRLTSVNIDNRGRISGVYGSGKVRYAGQVALTHFDAFELLSPFGENVFAATEASGTEEGGFTHDESGNTVDANGNPIPIRRDPTNPATGIALFNTYGVFRGKPGTANLGEIRSGALESSTVDLSSELVKLMVLQRTYASNSQSLRAQDQTLQTLLQTLG